MRKFAAAIEEEVLAWRTLLAFLLQRLLHRKVLGALEVLDVIYSEHVLDGAHPLGELLPIALAFRRVCLHPGSCSAYDGSVPCIKLAQLLWSRAQGFGYGVMIRFLQCSGHP